MKIPIRNLFYLLCYAWDVLDRADELEVGTSDTPDLENLMAEVLASGIEHLLRRGMEQGYVEIREDSKVIRGRVDFQQTVKRFLDRRREAHIVTEELSPDILYKSDFESLFSCASPLSDANHGKPRTRCWAAPWASWGLRNENLRIKLLST